MRNQATMEAGRLNRRVTIERPVLTQSGDGTTTTTWVPVAENIHAGIHPLSVRDFIAANARQSKITVRILIRYRAGLTADMRIRADDGTLYQPEGWLPDDQTGREWLTAPCRTL